MICCDKCEEWFHGRCIQVRQNEGDYIDKYVCPTCKEKGLGRTTYVYKMKTNAKSSPRRTTKGKKMNVGENIDVDSFVVDTSVSLSAEEKLKKLREERRLRREKLFQGRKNVIHVPKTIVIKNKKKISKVKLKPKKLNEKNKNELKRETYIKRICESLSYGNTKKSEEMMYTPEQAATAIENVLFQTFKSSKLKYIEKYRSLLFNLSDTQNNNLRRKNSSRYYHTRDPY